MRVWPCVLALAGCDRVFGIGDPYQDAARAMAGSDAMADTPADTPRDDATMPGDGTGTPMPVLLARFPFDGDLFDATRTQMATATGNVTASMTGGRFGGHVALDGTGCLVFTLAAQPATFSIVVWVEEGTTITTFVPLFVRPHVAASTVQDWAFYGDEQSYELRMSASTGPQTYTTSPGLSSSWHQFAATFDGTFVHQFVDGGDMGGISGTAPSYGGGSSVYLGCDGAGGLAKFAGGFDEVEIYDGALTAAQVMALTMAPPL